MVGVAGSSPAPRTIFIYLPRYLNRVGQVQVTQVRPKNSNASPARYREPVTTTRGEFAHWAKSLTEAACDCYMQLRIFFLEEFLIIGVGLQFD